MSVYESVLISIVSVYALSFLLFPSAALKRESQGGAPQKPAASLPSAEKTVLEKPKPALKVAEPIPAQPIPAQPKKAERAPEVSKPISVAKPVEVVPEQKAPKLSFLDRLKGGLSRTRKQMFSGLDDLFVSKDVKVKREEAFEAIFEMLIRCDVGVKTTDRLVEAVKEKVSGVELENIDALKSALREEMLKVFSEVKSVDHHVGSFDFEKKPHVVMVVGVNGVGKTTTTGKLAHLMRQKGAEVVIGAADTFRAAAVEQLGVWAQRSNAEFVKSKEGADPASVAFDAVKRAKEVAQGEKAQGETPVVCFVDTAGRLHNRADLMEELTKVRRVMAKADENAPAEVLLVVDATTGQNAIQQAKIFMKAVDVDGLVLTKLDGTAKGGVALAIAGDLGLPIRFVGVGEQVEDLQAFNSEDFIAALFG